MPLHFWGECVQTIAFLINRLPAPILQHQSPYSLMFHKEPDYSTLRSFGCLAFASTLVSTHDKFSPRAAPCVFLRYPIGVKGYRLYYLTTEKFVVSRDVVFHESTFPFHAMPNANHTPDLFSDVVIPRPCHDVSFPDPVAEPLAVTQPADVIQVDPQHGRRATRTHQPPPHLRDMSVTMLLI